MRRILPTSSVKGQSDTLSAQPLSSQVRLIRGLHKKRQERNKSVVKNRHQFSQKWRLVAANNFELMEEKGHEREAFENFAKYKVDWGTMTIPLYVSDISKLPPKKRFDFLYNVVQDRKGLSAFMKNKYCLEALECFVDMKSIGDVEDKYDKWSPMYQNHFLYMCDEVIKNSVAYSKIQHSAVASVIRAAAICDEVDCREKRNMCLDAAENMATKMDEMLVFKRPGEMVKTLQPWHNPYLDEKLKQKLQDEERFGVYEPVDRTPGKMKTRSFRLEAYPFLATEKQTPFYLRSNLAKLQRQIE